MREPAPPPPLVEGIPQTGGKADRGHRIPDDWRLSEADRRFARDADWTEPQIADAEAEFVDHWSNVPGKDGLKLDWSKAWRNRVRRFGAPGTSRNHSRNRSPEKSGVTDLLRDFEERIHERDNPGASVRGRAGSGAWPHDRSLDGRDRDGGAGPILDLEPIRSHDG